MVTWTLRRRKRVLWTAIVALSIGAIVSVVAPLVLPLDDAAPETPSAANRPAEQPRGQSDLDMSSRPLEYFTVIHQRPLRRPLYDPQPERKPEPERPKLNLTLVGTVVEPGFTYAMFRTPQRQQELVSVGEKIEGAELTAVRSDEAELLFHGETITLKIQRDGQ